MKVTVFYATEAVIEVDDKFAELLGCDLDAPKESAMVTELDAFLQSKLPVGAEIKFVSSDKGDLYEA